MYVHVYTDGAAARRRRAAARLRHALPPRGARLPGRRRGRDADAGRPLRQAARDSNNDANDNEHNKLLILAPNSN